LKNGAVNFDLNMQTKTIYYSYNYTEEKKLFHTTNAEMHGKQLCHRPMHLQ